MIVEIPDVLKPDQAMAIRARLQAADWVDGRVTAGYQAARVKNNAQLPEDHSLARELGDAVLAVLERTPLFVSAALPAKVYPPMFNRYAEGQTCPPRCS
jgi:PKHD-type hydroxylase